MGLLKVNVFESSVAFSGVQGYASSDGERPITAHVSFDQLRTLDLGVSPLALLKPLAGVRLLGLMRRQPQYAEPVATILSLAGAALLPDDCNAANFRMRDVVVTDPDTLGTFVGAGLNMSVAEMNSSIRWSSRKPIGPSNGRLESFWCLAEAASDYGFEATSPNLGQMSEDEIREAAERLGVKPPPESSN